MRAIWWLVCDEYLAFFGWPWLEFGSSDRKKNREKLSVTNQILTFITGCPGFLGQGFVWRCSFLSSCICSSIFIIQEWLDIHAFASNLISTCLQIRLYCEVFLTFLLLCHDGVINGRVAVRRHLRPWVEHNGWNHDLSDKDGNNL